MRVVATVSSPMPYALAANTTSTVAAFSRSPSGGEPSGFGSIPPQIDSNERQVAGGDEGCAMLSELVLTVVRLPDHKRQPSRLVIA